jgi:hypothetical protein
VAVVAVAELDGPRVDRGVLVDLDGHNRIVRTPPRRRYFPGGAIR